MLGRLRFHKSYESYKRISEPETKRDEKLLAYSEEFANVYDYFLRTTDSLGKTEIWNAEELGDMDSFYSNYLLTAITRIVAVDGKVTQKEVDYLNVSFEFDYTVETLTEIYEHCVDGLEVPFDQYLYEGIDKLTEIDAKLSETYKKLIAIACDIISESDGVVGAAEIAEAKRIKEMFGN